MLEMNSKFTCETCKDEFECPDTLIYFEKEDNEFGIIIQDGGTSSIRINYCPWCGKKL